MSANHLQIIWGVLLTLAGIGIFFRIPQVMPKLAELEIFTMAVIKFCFYFIAVILIGGGIKKVYNNLESLRKDKNDK